MSSRFSNKSGFGSDFNIVDEPEKKLLVKTILPSSVIQYLIIFFYMKTITLPILVTEKKHLVEKKKCSDHVADRES